MYCTKIKSGRIIRLLHNGIKTDIVIIDINRQEKNVKLRINNDDYLLCKNDRLSKRFFTIVLMDVVNGYVNNPVADIGISADRSVKISKH